MKATITLQHNHNIIYNLLKIHTIMSEMNANHPEGDPSNNCT